MKIVFLSSFCWPHIGGVEKHTWRIAQELVALGHTLHFITYHDDLKRSNEPGIEMHYLAHARRDHKLSTWQAVRKYKSLLDEADVIHVHDVMWWLWPWMVRWRSKLWITFHGWETVWPIPITSKLQRWIANKIARGSIHIGSWIQHFYWDSPSAVMYGASDIKQLSPLKAIHPMLKIVFVGRLEPDNQIEWYLDFLRELDARKIIYQMRWIGDGSLRVKAEKIGKVMGWIQEVEREVLNADVVLANSYLSILDAQASGSIVVAAATHPLKHAYLKCYPGVQWLVMHHQPVGAVDIVENMLKNQSSLKKHRAKQVTWAQHQTWKQRALDYLNLWEQA